MLIIALGGAIAYLAYTASIPTAKPLTVDDEPIPDDVWKPSPLIIDTDDNEP